MAVSRWLVGLAIITFSQVLSQPVSEDESPDCHMTHEGGHHRNSLTNAQSMALNNNARTDNGEGIPRFSKSETYEYKIPQTNNHNLKTATENNGVRKREVTAENVSEDVRATSPPGQLFQRADIPLHFGHFIPFGDFIRPFI